MTQPATKKRKLTMRHAAIAGAIAGVLCHLLPHQYQALCSSVTKLASLSCGAGGS